MKKAYPFLFEPEEHPTYGRRSVLPTTRRDLAGQIHFTSARMFIPDPDTFRLKPYQAYLDWYTRIHDLGDVIWPVYNFTDARDVKEFVDEVKKRNLYLFDIWGYVPGSYSNFASCGEVDFDPDLAAYLQRELGAHFLGFDNGEQDGRYIGGYASQMCPAGQNRQDQYDNFQRYFSFMHRHLRNDVSVLCSLNFGHYFLKEPDTKIIGSECAQALPNVNLWYAYLRGAGKQYGRIWFGNASVWNRWGWKEYDPAACSRAPADPPCGPEHGTSLSLLRRILYTHYTYNCDLLGYESGLLLSEKDSDEVPLLSPIGHVNQDAHAFVRRQGYPGALHTPVALYMDFHNGWTPPRHLYTQMIYRSWGNEPYTAGDHQAHALFSMIYPQYEEAGFYRDETGFLAATPYGDLFDVLFSDVSPEVLSAYNQVVLVGDAPLSLEDCDKLRLFVENGGSLTLFAGQIERAWQALAAFQPDLLSWFGLVSLGEMKHCAAQVPVIWNGREYAGPQSFDYYGATLLPQVSVTAAVEGQAAAYQLIRGQGKVTVMLFPFGLNANPEYDAGSANSGQISANKENQPICRPFQFIPLVKAILADAFQQEQIVRLDNPNLQYSVNLRSEGRLLLTVINNTACRQHYNITLAGAAEFTARTIDVPDYERTTAGYYSPAYQPGPTDLAGAGRYQLDPMQIAMFEIVPRLPVFEAKPKICQPDRTGRLYLRLDPSRSIQRQLNRAPTLDSHFRGIRLDARYLLDRSAQTLQIEGAAVRRYGLDVILDCSALFNNYPDWSQLDVVMERYARTLREFSTCLDLAEEWGCQKVIIMLQRTIETGCTAEAAEASLLRTLFYMADACKSRKMTLYLQNGTPRRLWANFRELAEKLREHQIRSIKLALNISHVLICGEDLQELLERQAGNIAGLLISAPEQDAFGQFTDRHSPLCRSAYQETVVNWTQALRRQCQPDFILLDSCYENQNEIWADLRLLD